MDRKKTTKRTVHRTLRAVPGRPIVQLVENGEVLRETWNFTLHYLIEHGFAVTVERYIQFNTLGDASTLSEVGPETRAEIEGLVDAGFLIDLIGRVN